MKASLEVVKPHDMIYKTKKRRVVEDGARSSGKSKAVAQSVYVFTNKYPKHDILIARANYNSLKGSIFAEILQVAEEVGDETYYSAKTSPLEITTKHGNTIHFRGIGGADYSRSKGFNPYQKNKNVKKKRKNKMSLIIIEEAEQLKDEQSLKQALATFMRSLDGEIDSKIIIVGNPEMVKGHWWNVFCKQSAAIPQYEVIHSTYKDVYKFLQPDMREEIAIEKKYNPSMYKFLYEGLVDDLAGGAYAQFKRERDYISVRQWEEETAKETLVYVIWGGDGAIKRDGTGLMPLFVYSNGKAYVLERFYYNPKKTGKILAPSQLVDLILMYVKTVVQKYNIIEDGVGSCFSIDCAAADLITQLSYNIDPYHYVKGFTQKDILKNNAIVNDAFARGMVKIVDFGGYFDWNEMRYIETTADTEPLIVQLESVTWKDNTGKYDPIIENDYTDALTYGINEYFMNPENLDLPERRKYYE